jgi:hypothetical protein
MRTGTVVSAGNVMAGNAAAGGVVGRGLALLAEGFSRRSSLRGGWEAWVRAD